MKVRKAARLSAGEAPPGARPTGLKNYMLTASIQTLRTAPGRRTCPANLQRNIFTTEHGRSSRATPVRMSVSKPASTRTAARSEEHTSELQSRGHLVCRLLLEK